MALLARAITMIDWGSIEQALPNIQLSWLAVTLILLWLSNALSGMRWGKIMQAGSFSYPIFQFVRWYFSGGLINQGLPTTLGGDSYRAMCAHQGLPKLASVPPDLSLPNDQQPNLKSSFFNVALDRSLGFAGNSLLGAIGLGLGGYIMNDWVSPLGWGLFITMLLGAGLIAFLLQVSFCRPFIEKTLHRLDIKHGLKTMQAAWGWPNISYQIPLAVGIHFLTLAAFWACLKACHISAPIEALLIGIPALGILMILPISISGWGIRETSLASILGLWGLDTSLVILSSILYGLITLLTFLPGIVRLLVKQPTNLR